MGIVFFGAWLRTSHNSPCEWLWEEVAPARDDSRPSDFMPTMAFFLWLAGANIPVEWSGESSPPAPCKNAALPALQWNTRNDFNFDLDFDLRIWEDELEMDIEFDIVFEDFIWHAPMENEIAGHLRKEIYANQTQRSLRRESRRRAPKSANKKQQAGGPEAWSAPKANRTLF